MPRKVGNYEIIQTLGEGMTGKVKLGKHIETGDLVALKVIKKSGQTQREIELLYREITALTTLSHPNILKLLSVDMNASYPRRCGLRRSSVILAMEFAQNGELFHYIYQMPPFLEALARTYYFQLVSALNACHQMGIYHRDIKLQNLLLDHDFQLKLADFGLVAFMKPENGSSSSLFDTECGTTSYMPPEMLSEVPYDGGKADVWSSLIVLFVLLTTCPPFQVADRQDWWFQQFTNGRKDRFWSGFLKNFSISEETQAFINRSLVANPTLRPTTQQILDDIWMQGEQLTKFQLITLMTQRKNMIQDQKEKERNIDYEKMKQKQLLHINFNPFMHILRSINPPIFSHHEDIPSSPKADKTNETRPIAMVLTKSLESDPMELCSSFSSEFFGNVKMNNKNEELIDDI